jgi:gliding motility-associated-like protein
MAFYLQNIFNIKKASILAASLIISGGTYAQMVDDNVFLKGKYVEVGIAPIGAFGSTVNAPEGYHPRLWSGSTGPAQLGFVSDPDMDGWDVGTPNYVGCYFLPGDPQEGWDVQVDGVWNRAWRGSTPGGGLLFGGSPLLLDGENTAYYTEGTKVVGVWEGSMGNLAIRQTTELDTTKAYFIVKVDLKNTGTTPLVNVYYDRTVDADQESSTPGGMGSTTVNTIVYQPDPSATSEDGMKCLASSTGPALGDIAYLGLGAVDCRAKCYIVGGYSLNPDPWSSETSLDKIYDEELSTSPAYIYDKDGSRTADVGIGIVFNIGTMLPGDSTSLAYAYILRVQDLDSAFNSLAPAWILNGEPFSTGDTLKKCWGAEVDVAIQGGGAYVWGEWEELNGGPTLPAGRTNIVQMEHAPLTYRVIGTNPICPLSDTLIMTFIPEGDSVIINERICAGNTYNFMGDLKYQTGTYVNMRKTSIGCDSIVLLNLIVDPLPEVAVTARETEICEGEEALLGLTAPSSFANYQWYKNGSPIPGATQHSYAATTPGIYYVAGGTDRGCTAQSKQIEVIVNPAASGTIVSVDKQDICIGDTITVKSDAKPNYQYTWSPEAYFRYTGGNLNPSATGIIPKTTEVYLTSMNEYGCRDFDTVVVQAHPCCDIFIPTAFSPNNDGLNDYFLPSLRNGQVVVSLQIFARNGQLVYDNNEPLKGWNGRMNNSGELLPQTVYMYRFIYTCTDGEVYETKGDISLIR